MTDLGQQLFAENVARMRTDAAIIKARQDEDYEGRQLNYQERVEQEQARNRDIEGRQEP